MPKLSISKAATERIITERDARTNFLFPVIPRLDYYRRSYSTLKDEHIIEHGSGFTLSFIKPADAAGYIMVRLDGGGSVAVGPSAMFRAGSYLVDWDGKKFTLASPE